MPEFTSVSQSEEKSKALKLGLIELLVIVVIAVITLSILNYFNVLKLSSSLPSILGWLPHQEESAQVPNKIISTESSITASPTPELLPFPPFSKDVQAASVQYVLQGSVQTIQPLSNGNYEVRLKFDDNITRKFEIAKTSEVLLVTNSPRYVPIKISEVELTNIILINANYNLKTKKWETATPVTFSAVPTP